VGRCTVTEKRINGLTYHEWCAAAAMRPSNYTAAAAWACGHTPQEFRQSTTAKEAIAQSLALDATVTLDYNEHELDALLRLTQDYVRGPSQWQFWGETDDGRAWHVNVRFP